MGSVFNAPKPPPPVAPPPTKADVPSDVLTEDRLRRQKAYGRSSNIVSSLADQVTDTQSSSRISTLLG